MAEPDDTGSNLWPEIRRMSENLVMINTKLDEIPSRLTDHELRIRRLEERRFPLQSIGAIIAVLSLVVAIAAIYITK